MLMMLHNYDSAFSNPAHKMHTKDLIRSSKTNFLSKHKRIIKYSGTCVERLMCPRYLFTKGFCNTESFKCWIILVVYRKEVTYKTWWTILYFILNQFHYSFEPWHIIFKQVNLTFLLLLQIIIIMYS